MTLRACAFAAIIFLSHAAVAQTAPPQSVAIDIKNFDFAPMDISVPAGTSVTWKNLDGEPHTVTSLDGLFRSGAIDQDESFTFRFDKPGVYAYLCSIHPKMRATITVR